ncbi:MAG TPA: C39 family peptidase [Steroidobacteraceae bacterium]|nr:C39 family peptidase [Steroidobacteraceae bacterium]
MRIGVLILAWGVASLTQAATVEVRGPHDGGFAARVLSVKEARFTTTVRQQYDFSCGSAAIATLLTHHYGIPVTEREVFAQMFERGDQAKIRKEGFSMLDMKRYLESRGFLADGFEQPLERLEQERLPAIVLLSERGYRHFVVVKGIARGRVLVGDPAMGTRTLSFDRFSSLWVNHLLFVVHNRRETARFNLASDWRVAPGAPLFQAVTRERMLDSLPVRRAGAF